MTRAELLKYVDQQRESQGPDGSYDLKDSQVFVYEALSKELFVGNVYLRVYNDQPDFEISEPEAFCVALIEFISHQVRNRCATSFDSQDEVNDSGSSPEAFEHPNETAHVSSNKKHETSENHSEVAAASLDEQKISDDSLEVSDGQVANKEKFDVFKNLQSGLISLKVHILLNLSFFFFFGGLIKLGRGDGEPATATLPRCGQWSLPTVPGGPRLADKVWDPSR